MSGSLARLLDYELPQELIAQVPAEPRDNSRLLVVDRLAGTMADHRFHELHCLLQPGDLLVVNDTRVIPARLYTRRESGGRVEFLLLERVADRRWEALARPLARLRPGERLKPDTPVCSYSDAAITYLSRSGEIATIELDDESIINDYGHVPLPPYIQTVLANQERYQTVYARHRGSAAAPTAGLHFTPQLLDNCRERGIGISSVTLHVGIDTFRPILADDVDDHVMHSEWFRVSRETIERMRVTRQAGNRIVAVGTTTTRVLESIDPELNVDESTTGRTDLYVRPPYEFRYVDAMITNFHLPRTTLLLLVGAFAGVDLLTDAYRHAIEDRYRFYSFGDAMLIV